MTDGYPLSDRQIYGAEDDFEMDLILAAIDRALEEPKPAETPARKTPGNGATATPRVATATCAKTPYRTQVAARKALARWRAVRPDDPNLPHRVYPCDRCDRWHLTSKNSGRRLPPWDRNPQWERPSSELAKLQPRFKG